MSIRETYLAEERREKIIQIVSHAGLCTVPQLCSQLNASPATIRRDLQKLAGEKRLLRSRNGAVPYQEHHMEPSIHFRAGENAAAKDRIAEAASALIKNDSLIFIDSSTTALSLVNYLQNLNGLTIVSNSLLLMTLLRGTPHRLILTGGDYYEPSHAFYGPIAVDTIRAFNFDMAFISSVAITPQGYAAETLEHSVSIRRAAIEHSNFSVLMCDKSKFNKSRPYNMAAIADMDLLITDDREHLQDTAIRVIRV